MTTTVHVSTVTIYRTRTASKPLNSQELASGGRNPRSSMASASINRSLIFRRRHHHHHLPIQTKALNLAPISIFKFGNLALRKSGCHARIRIRAAASSSLSSSSTDDDLRPDIDENPEGIISGEWPEHHSLLCYDDFRAYLETQIISKKTTPTALLGDVMSTYIRAATADQTLEEIDHNFEFVSGLPVIDAEKRCIGVVSKSDRDKTHNGLKSKVGEVMSTPAITLSPDKTVLDAAALMLKKKIHRIPILNEEQRVIGMVTRSDIFQALETAPV